MKKLLTLILIAACGTNLQAQCPNDNDLMWGLTPGGPGDTQVGFCAWGGESYPVDVIQGETYEFSTCGGNWDTQITLYGSGGNVLGFNDDFCGLQSFISFTASITETIYVLLDEYNCSDRSTCGVNLSVSQLGVAPQNDVCLDAIDISCGQTITGSTASATNTGGINCGTSVSAPGVWFHIIGNGELITLDLCNSSYDTKINLYSGSCGDLSCVDGNDDACGWQSALSFMSLDNVDYYLLVQGFGGDTGDFELILSCEDVDLSSSQQECAGAATICDDSTLDGNSEGAGFVQDLSGVNRGCLGVEHQSNWFVFSPVTTGHIEFTLTPTNGIDYDFAIWGPFDQEQTPCPPVGDPLRCSFSALYAPTGLALGAGDTSEDPSGDAWVEAIEVETEDLDKNYVMLIDNFTADNSSYSLDWELTGVTLNCALLLPVELIRFEGKALQDRNELIWTTASEYNNDYFEVQRSTNLSDWEVIQLVDGLGTSQNETTYIANDGERPYGTAYYRLRQVDFNGASELSDIISITHFQQLDLMAVFPNPGSGKFKVLFRMFDASPIKLIAHDLSGRIIHDEALKTEEGVNDLMLDLSDAPSGTYFLKFVDQYGSTLNQSRISIK